MKISKLLLILILFAAAFSSCKEDEDTDQTAPIIDLSAEDAFPQQCDTLYRGQTFTFIATFTDNEGLGSYSLDVHNNFDHHSHTTEVEECDPWPDQTPINPYLLIEGYEIPGAPQSFTTQLEITIPDDVDMGDYHFMIRVVDVNGWQAMKGLSVKIL